MKKILVIFILLLIIKGGVLAMKDIRLPDPDTKGKMPLETAIHLRRSARSFVDKSLTMKQVSQLLWAAQGITDDTKSFRSAPSAGALYPLTVYVVKNDGCFEYIPETHSVKMVSNKDLRDGLASAALGQSSISEAAADIVITADYRITELKYGSRAERYVLLEAGHAAQNLLLEAVALGLSGVPVGAFHDNKIKEVLHAEKDPIYIVPIGYAKE